MTATAPTEAEIREAIEDDAYGWNQLADALTTLGAGPLDSLYDSDDCRKSELDDLDAIATDVKAVILARVKAEITEALVSGALAFAAKHPDAPRAVREAVTA